VRPRLVVGAGAAVAAGGEIQRRLRQVVKVRPGPGGGAVRTDARDPVRRRLEERLHRAGQDVIAAVRADHQTLDSRDREVGRVWSLIEAGVGHLDGPAWNRAARRHARVQDVGRRGHLDAPGDGPVSRDAQQDGGLIRRHHARVAGVRPVTARIDGSPDRAVAPDGQTGRGRPEVGGAGGRGGERHPPCEGPVRIDRGDLVARRGVQRTAVDAHVGTTRGVHHDLERENILRILSGHERGLPRHRRAAGRGDRGQARTRRTVASHRRRSAGLQRRRASIGLGGRARPRIHGSGPPAGTSLRADEQAGARATRGCHRDPEQREAAPHRRQSTGHLL
jgi:hypothetical protein